MGHFQQEHWRRSSYFCPEEVSQAPQNRRELKFGGLLNIHSLPPLLPGRSAPGNPWGQLLPRSARQLCPHSAPSPLLLWGDLQSWALPLFPKVPTGMTLASGFQEGVAESASVPMEAFSKKCTFLAFSQSASGSW